MTELLPIRPLTELRTRRSAKWTRYPADVVPMHVAEMDYDVSPAVLSALRDMVDASDLGYFGPLPDVTDAFVGFAARHWGWHVDAGQVRYATDVGVGVVEVLRAIAHSGDRVLINSPVYSGFTYWTNELGLNRVDVPLRFSAGEWTLDFDGIEQAFSSGVSLYLLCSPHNPVGRVYSRTELERIADLAARYNVTVISDEIHAPLAQPDHPFTPYLAVSDNARATGITVTAASKSFNLAGLKAAVVVTGSSLQADRLAGMPPAMHWRSGLLGAVALGEAFARSDEWLTRAVATNRAGRDLLTSLVSRHLPTVGYQAAEASYLAWLDVSSLDCGGRKPYDAILDDHRIAVVSGEEHGPGYEQFVRINFACEPASIVAIIEALASYPVRTA